MKQREENFPCWLQTKIVRPTTQCSEPPQRALLVWLSVWHLLANVVFYVQAIKNHWRSGGGEQRGSPRWESWTLTESPLAILKTQLQTKPGPRPPWLTLTVGCYSSISQSWQSRLAAWWPRFKSCRASKWKKSELLQKWSFQKAGCHLLAS